MAPAIKPFLPARPSGIVFIGLNVVRILSIIALLLVFSANFVTMVQDIKAIRNPAPADSGTWDCEYIEYSTVPDQTGGPFWSVLNRIFITFECILLVLSETGVPRSLFETYLPILGPAYGLGYLGVFEMLIATQMLSHYCDLFPQAVSWLLFIVGCFNVIAGIVFTSKGKERRLIFTWENVSSLTPQTRMAATAWETVTDKRSASSSSHGAKDVEKMDDIPLDRSATNHSDRASPLLPPGIAQNLGDRFAGLRDGLGGFGFGKQGENRAGDRGVKISRPLETLPRE